LQFVLQAASRPREPHLLILDEMNLAHVERYFADFLSGMETQKPCLPNLKLGEDGAFRLAPGVPSRIPVPPNLFVVGTVNVDETTYLFSPKVLDRANTIELRVRTEDLSTSSRRPTACSAGPGPIVRAFLAVSADEGWHARHPAPSADLFANELRQIHAALAEDGYEFGHRVFYEALRFAALLVAAGEPDPHRALDLQVMQKLLPRLHGSRRRLEPTLRMLGAACLSAPPDAETWRRFDPLAAPAPGLKLPRSFDKIRRMLRNLIANQFTSFTE
jgi:5-methylcytosine-specific restriction protein B